MRPAIEVYRCASYEDAKLYGSIEGEEAAAAVIEADRAELVAGIVQYLRQLDATRDESNLIGWAANRVQAEFGGTDG